MTAPSSAPPPPLTAPPPAPPEQAARRRLDGIDVARALAIIGMVSVHVAPPLVTLARAGEGGWYSLPHGRASALFAFVAGLGITLASRRGSFATNASRLVWRAAWLYPLGLLLTALGTPVAVILQYYAVWFLLAIPFLRAPTWLLWTTTAVGSVVGPTVLVWAQVTHPAWYSPPGAGAWAGTLGDVLLTGYYPTVSWLWIVVAGMAVARLDLGDRRVMAGVALAGSGVALVAYAAADRLDAVVDLGPYEDWFATIGHSDTPLETIAVTGVAAAVTGACLLLADLAPPLFAPLAALGRLALTVYVGHIVLYAVAPDLLYSFTVPEAATTTLWIAGVATLVSVVWLAAFRRGPLEALDRGGHRHLVLPLVESITSGGAPTGRG